jgi:hypothetical protein
MTTHGGSLHHDQVAALEYGERVVHVGPVARLVDGDVRRREDLVRVGPDIASDDHFGAVRRHSAAGLHSSPAAGACLGRSLDRRLLHDRPCQLRVSDWRRSTRSSI